jgi:FkbM family methyltransferase
MLHQVIPTTLEVGGRQLHYDHVIDLHHDDPIGTQLANGDWAFSGALLWLLGNIEPGDTVLDLGAHLGTFSIPAAMLGARVVAVEGSPRNAALLRAACAQNDLGPDAVTVCEVVVDISVGQVQFVELGPYGTIATSGIGADTGYPTIAATTTTVDLLPGGPFRWAKIDIEGMEEAIMRSAEHWLSSVHGLVVESNGYMLHSHGSSPAELVGAIERAGLRVYEVGPGILRPLHQPFVQPETIVDYIAAPGDPALPAGWRSVPGRTRHEILEALLLEAQHPIAEHRDHATRSIDQLSRHMARQLKRRRSTPPSP